MVKLAWRRPYSLLVAESLRKYLRWYPNDAVTYANIQTYLDSRSVKTQTLLVGVVYESDSVRQRSRVLDALLADPLSESSKSWFPKLVQRSRTENNLVVHRLHQADLGIPSAFERTVTRIETALPMLSALYRQRFEQVFPPAPTTNNVAFLEINKHDDVLKLTDTCHFFVYVTKEFSSMMETMHRHVQKKVLLTIVDNGEFSPLSLETTPATFDTGHQMTHHALKVDSQRVYNGICSFIDSEKNADLYFDAIRSSNILELSKFFVWHFRPENLRSWQFQIIVREISSNNLSEKTMREIYNDLKLNTLVECSTLMHRELQLRLIPETERFFSQKLRWWMLYYRNDNVEYCLKDFFGKSFMPGSITYYNYVRGQLTARLQQQKFAKYQDSTTVENPLLIFKQDLVNERISHEVQPEVFKIISSAFLTYQAPISLLSLLGYMYFGIQAEGAFALALLGWVVGFNDVSKKWDVFSQRWLHSLFEDVRLTIVEKCLNNGLLKELNTRYEEAKGLAVIKKQVVDNLERANASKNI